MKTLATATLLCLSFLFENISGANAIRISGKWIPWEERMQRRSAMSSMLQDDGDLKYYTNITLNDEVFPVLIDTGRSVSILEDIVIVFLLFIAPTCTSQVTSPVQAVQAKQEP
jgi:hypothetical protein